MIRLGHLQEPINQRYAQPLVQVAPTAEGSLFTDLVFLIPARLITAIFVVTMDGNGHEAPFKVYWGLS